MKGLSQRFRIAAWWRRAAVAFAAPVCLFLLAEAALRVAGYGFAPDFVLKERQGAARLCHSNVRYGWRFFPPRLARECTPFEFMAPKQPGVRRIVKGLIEELRCPPYTGQSDNAAHRAALESRRVALEVEATREGLRETAVEYEAALRQTPTDWWLHWKYGQWLLEDLGDSAGAAAQHRVVKAILPDSEKGYAGLAAALRAAGDVDGALAEDLQAIRINPNQHIVHGNLGLTYQLKGRFRDAAREFGEALRLRPDYEKAYNNYSIMLSQEGQLDNAIALCRRGLTFLPDSWNLYHNLGVFFSMQGKTKEAVAAYRRALEIDPASQRTQEALREIQP